MRKPKREGQLEAGSCSTEKECERSKLWNQEEKAGAATSLEPETSCPQAMRAGAPAASSSDQSLTLHLISKPFSRPAAIFNSYPPYLTPAPVTAYKTGMPTPVT